jgi:hypothetical protein
MALVLKDRVKETSVSTGTGAIALDGATGAYQTFSTIGNGNTTYYCIAGQTTNEWEVGIGTYTTSTDTLSRDTILASSNSNTIVTFSAGTKDVFITYPSEKAIYEEADGDTLINAGPITVLGPGVSGIPTPYDETLGRFYGNVDSFQQLYIQNQYNGVDASSDIVAYNNLGDGTNYFIDMGMAGSTYSSMSYPIFSANSAYLYNTGLTTGTGAAGETSELLIGTGTLNSDLVLFTGGVDTTNEAVRISGADQTIEVQKGVTLNETLDVTGAATFGGTVLLDANPTTALQAATKQYVDNQVTAGLHIHEPVRVETTANLTATYVQGGTTFNITTITSTTTVTTSVNHGLVVNDQIWLTTTAGNGLSINTAYFVFSTPALNQLTLSLTFDGTQITGLTNAAGLTYATRANSGVGATLTNAGTQVALNVDSIALSVADRVMVRLQTNGAENGVYVVTTVGSGSTNWVLTRSTDTNMVNPGDPNGLGTGDYFFTQEGAINAGDSHVLTTEPNTMIIGYTPLTYTQFSGSVDYVGGTNIDITGQTISLTGTVAATNGGTGVNTVTTGDILYGSATNAWSKLGLGSAYQSLVVNGSGTQVEWNAVNLSSAVAVTGTLGATYGGTGQTTYATGDMLYSSATNTIAKLSGNTSTTKQYLSQTGTGSVSAAPSWATISAADIGAGTLSAVRGGTGQSSYSIGDILYADTTTSLARLADVAVGNALISGGLDTAPSWGKIALASAVSGTLGLTNGGTGQTTANAAFNALAPSQATNSGKYLTTNGTDTSWATVTQTTFSAGTTGFTPATATSGAVTLAGTLNIANGGTGATTAQAAINALAGATTSGQYLRGNGTNVVMAAIVAGDVPTLNQNTTGTAGNVTGTVAVLNGGTGSTTAGGARTNLGATTVGSNFFTLTNPSAITFPRMNADNTVSSLDAATFRTAIGAGTSSTTGTVTSVSGTAPIAVATGTTTPAISIAQATTSTSGYLSSTDWNTFNGKQAAGSYVTVGGALGTPSSGTLTNCTFPTLNQNTTGSSGSCTGNSATATSAGNADTTDGYHASLVESVNTLATRNASGYLHASYFNGTGTFATTGNTSGMARFTGTNGTDTYGRSYTVAAAAAALSGQTMNINGSSTSCSGTAYLASAVSYLPNRTDAAAYQVVWGAPYTSGSGTIAYSCAAVTITSSTGQLSAGILYSSGNVTAYSDERVKTNWRSVSSNFVEQLAEVKSGVYDRTDCELTQAGVSAQSWKKVLPETVCENEEGHLSVVYGHAALVSAVELAKELVALKELVKELKAEVDELKKAK